MASTRMMEMKDILYLRKRDSLILNEPIGKLGRGKAYHLQNIEAAFKSGEGSLLGYLMDVEGEKIPFECFRVDDSLDAKLAERKQRNPNEHEHLLYRGSRVSIAVGVKSPDFKRKE